MTKKIFFLLILLVTITGCTSSNEAKLNNLKIENEELKSQIDNDDVLIKELKDTNAQLVTRNKRLESLNERLIDPDFIEDYIPQKMSELGGYYYYNGGEVPVIYPNKASPTVTDKEIEWLRDNPIVEVIIETSDKFCLVRIPTLEKYVYIKSNDLSPLKDSDIPTISDVSVSINDCYIGDSIEKLKLTYSGNITFGVENGTKMVGFFNGSEMQGTAFVDDFKRIIGFRISTEDFIFDDKYSVGDNALEAIEFYDNKFGRDESYKDDGYVYTKERYVYIDGTYYFELTFDTDELDASSKITQIECQTKWW